jgi:hypothetical protein
MADKRAAPAFRASFDAAAFAEDLAHAGGAARRVALAAQREFARSGVRADSLRPCDPEARDGTQLPNCVKTYLPAPAGPWGMVFELVADDQAQLILHYLAFGERHPTSASKPSVYQVADRRLRAL